MIKNAHGKRGGVGFAKGRSAAFRTAGGARNAAGIRKGIGRGKNVSAKAKEASSGDSGRMPIAISHVVKRKGHLEPFDERKAYGSIYWAAKSAHLDEKAAEKIAESVVAELKIFVRQKHAVDSREIFGFICQKMRKIDPDAEYMYRTHLDIS
ncbi:MAG TPA: ATP cone domain-containing protein [Candidatus Norongarragalinales archaeon]|nr:ATP cone domain-containing protein [Candidatus Norongarragalinales archaeon]